LLDLKHFVFIGCKAKVKEIIREILKAEIKMETKLIKKQRNWGKFLILSCFLVLLKELGSNLDPRLKEGARDHGSEAKQHFIGLKQ